MPYLFGAQTYTDCDWYGQTAYAQQYQIVPYTGCAVYDLQPTAYAYRTVPMVSSGYYGPDFRIAALRGLSSPYRLSMFDRLGACYLRASKLRLSMFDRSMFDRLGARYLRDVKLGSSMLDCMVDNKRLYDTITKLGSPLYRFSDIDRLWNGSALKLSLPRDIISYSGLTVVSSAAEEHLQKVLLEAAREAKQRAAESEADAKRLFIELKAAKETGDNKPNAKRVATCSVGRYELLQKNVSDLRKLAIHAGVSEKDIDAALDGADMKTALVNLVQTKELEAA